MTKLLMIRHAATSWNRCQRIQGVSDIPIDDAARQEIAGWRVPDAFADAVWVSSPLGRAMETARLLGGNPEPEQRLTEMNWGEWEGRTLKDLRAELGEPMVQNENRGIDFRPTGGESPREIQDRLRPWLSEIATAGNDTVAVTHKGVIRAVMAMATGWNMMGKPPARVLNGSGHRFVVNADGEPVVHGLNISLQEGRATL